MVTTSIRDQALAALKRLPKDCSFEDLQYRLYVLEKVRKGEESLREPGGAVSHAAAKRRMKKWLSM